MSVLTDDQFQLFLDKGRIVDYELGDRIDCGTEESAALCILLSGGARLVDQQSAEQTLCLVTEFGSFCSSELSRRANISCPEIHASGSASLLRLDGADLAQLIQQSEALNEKLEQESRILHAFILLRSTPRFAKIEFWKFRPILSQCALRHFSEGTDFAGVEGAEGKTGPSADASEGLYILLKGKILCGDASDSACLQPGDWFSRGSIVPGHDSHNAKERAATDAEVLFVSQEAFGKLREINPELISQMDMILMSTHGIETGVETGGSAPHVLAHVTEAEPPLQKSPESVSIADEPAGTKLRRQFKQYPHVYQHSELECAITCLHMVFLFYGKKVSLVQLRELCEIGRSGSSMLELAEAAEQLGFVARGVRTSSAGLSRLRLPLILYWKRNHFVVLYEIHPDYAVIGDPAEGLNKIEIEKLRKEFSEHALELAPTVQWFEQSIKSKPLWHTFEPLLRSQRKLIVDVLVCSVFFQVLQLAVPVFTQVVVDQVIVHQDLDTLNILLLGMLLMTLFQAAMGFLRQFFVAFLSLKTDQSLFTELLKKLFSLPLEYFGKHATGDTLTRFAEGTGAVQFLTGLGVTSLLDVMMAIVFLGVVFIYNVTFGLVAAAYVAVLSIFLFLCAPALKELSQRAYDKQMAAESFLVEAIQGIERIKSAAAERRSRWKWESLFLDNLNVRFREFVAGSGVSAVTRLLQLAAQITFLFLGAHMIIGKELTVGQLMAMTMLMTMILQPFMRLADLAQVFQTVSVALERIVEVFLEKPEEADQTAKIRLTNVSGHIKLEGVSYRYPGREGGNALTKCSFEARPGQMIGIVGRSGSGKTTLTKVIQGLYQPTEGRILVDNHELSQILLSSFRRRIGVVSQDEYYFRGTVRENIAFYKPDATMEEIINACTVSGINALMSSLPSGYETVLSEGAANFSGGQRQCMAIARAILHEPSILIFDEATSAMDSETERLIQECMERLRANSTMFVVAHRLSTVTSADLILVLDQGQIVESGTHEQLMQEKGLYYHLCKKQELSV